MQKSDFNTGLLNFLNNSPTAFHAAASARKLLKDNNFIHLPEAQTWELKAAGKYFVTRNNSSIIAFTLTENALSDTGLRIVGAHTDSPALKVKPFPLQDDHNCVRVGIEVYGGALLTPWFDRDLSIAGRITYRKNNGTLKSKLIDFRRPIAIIPSLAIHLAKDSTKSCDINKENELTPILMLSNNNTPPDFTTLLHEQLSLEYDRIDIDEIIDHELFFYDTQPACLTGINKDFISGARLDNLLSCYTAIRAICNGTPQSNAMIILSDHEEIGSTSTSGAKGSFLRDTLDRILPNTEENLRCKAKSLLISADNAHTLHPNYPDKYDHKHAPLFNHGPAIKLNAEQRYATNSITSSFFQTLCKQANIPVQQFVMRSDMACGSTVGPLISAETGIKTIDVGVPSLAMHSIRETIGSNDGWYLYRACNKFFELPFNCNEWTSISK
ncbi:MAG: M18 family aminopeptidase [Desulfobulbaceae bacterium]|nr:M18 family aminopeptidase [Desulfobulbaceae bacterium]